MAVGGSMTRVHQRTQSIEAVARVIGDIVPAGHDPP